MSTTDNAESIALLFLSLKLGLAQDALERGLERKEAMLVAMHGMIVEAIREDRRTRAPDEGVREVLRDLKKGLDAHVKKERKAGADAGDRHDSMDADRAGQREDAFREAAKLVQAALAKAVQNEHA